MNYQACASLFDTNTQRVLAIVGEGLCAGGWNDRNEMLNVPGQNTDAELTGELLHVWDWVLDDETTKTDVREVFAEIRTNFDEHFPDPDARNACPLDKGYLSTPRAITLRSADPRQLRLSKRKAVQRAQAYRLYKTGYFVQV